MPSTIGRSPVIAAPTPIPCEKRKGARGEASHPSGQRLVALASYQEGVLADGRVQHTQGPVLLVQVVGDLVRAAIVAHILLGFGKGTVGETNACSGRVTARRKTRQLGACIPPWTRLSHDADVRVGLHLLIDGLAKGLPHKLLLLISSHPDGRRPGGPLACRRIGGTGRESKAGRRAKKERSGPAQLCHEKAGLFEATCRIASPPCRTNRYIHRKMLKGSIRTAFTTRTSKRMDGPMLPRMPSRWGPSGGRTGIQMDKTHSCNTWGSPR